MLRAGSPTAVLQNVLRWRMCQSAQSQLARGGANLSAETCPIIVLYATRSACQEYARPCAPCSAMANHCHVEAYEGLLEALHPRTAQLPCPLRPWRWWARPAGPCEAFDSVAEEPGMQEREAVGMPLGHRSQWHLAPCKKGQPRLRSAQDFGVQEPPIGFEPMT